MYKWSLLLLASLAVFHPIASFNLVDGRQQCCDHQPLLLHRDTRVDVYGPYRFNKLASDDRRLNNQREIPETRGRYEVRSVESALSRETESPASRRVIPDHTARFSRVDRRAFVRIEPHDQRSRQVSRDRFSRVSDQNERVYRESQIRISRDDTTRVADERRSRISMEGRRDQRLLRETNSIRYNRATRKARDLPQRTRNDLVQADMRNRRVSREAENMDRRGYVAATEFRRQNVRDDKRKYFSLERRVRDVTQTRLPLARARSADETRRITKDNSDIRNIDLNRRATRHTFEMERRIRLTPESRRLTDSDRVARVLNVRDQTREDFRQERRAASPERVTRTAVREDRTRSAERSEERQSRRIREEIKEFHNNARDNRRNTIEIRRNVRSVDRSNTRGNDVERRFAAMSIDRRTNQVSESRSTLFSRDEPRNMIRNDIRHIRNIREREISDGERHEQRSLTREDRRTIFENIRSENRVMARRDTRTSRPLDVRSRNMEERIARVVENDRRSRSQASTRTDARRNSRNDERHVEHRRHSTDRRMKLSLRETREGMVIVRQARSVERVRSERRDTRFDNRADTRNQRSTRFDGRSDALVHESRKLEREVSRTRDNRINDERIQAVRESRNREVKDTHTRDISEMRSRLALEAARYRHDFVSKTTEPTSYALNWQYLFYTLQGIYLCGIIIKMMNETPDKQKTRSWWVSTKAVKVD